MSATYTEAGASFPGAPGVGIGLDGFGTQGAQIGALVGCDLNASGWVFGAFADWVHQDLEWRLSATDGVDSASLTTAMGDQWTIGARIGHMITPTTLLYGLVGYSEAKGGDITLASTVGLNGAIDLGDFKGYVLGGGLEAEMMRNVLIGIEYRYGSYDTRRIDLGVANIDLDTETHTARLTLSYRFGGSDPLQPMK